MTKKATKVAEDAKVYSLLARMEADAQEHKLKSKQFRLLLDELSKEIVAAATTAPNEATLAAHFEARLYHFLKVAFGKEFLPTKETPVDTVRHVTKGRLDSRVGALVVEYKHRTKLATSKDHAKALSQLENYLTSLTASAGQTLTGILTDGTRGQAIEVTAGKVTARTPLSAFGVSHLEHFVRHALLLDRTALSPENLVKDFCGPSDPIAMQLATTLFKALNNAPTERTRMLFQEWQALFRLAHDDVSKQTAIIERRKALGDCFQIKIAEGDNDTEYKALFALQTAFAIIVKLVALKVISAIRAGLGAISFNALAVANDAALQSKLLRVEEGDVFRDMGFSNLLEGDFFSWYCTSKQWGAELAGAVRAVFGVLAAYEEQPLLKGSERLRDFFKDLYIRLMPDKVRHSLGEFYTPPWLADHLIQEGLKLTAVGKPISVLDPCCGSGTFLTSAMRHVLKGMDDAAPGEQLQAVLKAVKGVDLNPLAVLTARINYFINVSHLVGDDDELEIPVFLGDASYVPSKVVKGGVPFITYELRTLKGTLSVAIPESALENMDRFSHAMNALETHIRHCDRAAIVEELWQLSASAQAAHAGFIRSELSRLADELVKLQENDWNGIWARIITNFLTTRSLGKFELVVGNPPWVDWKNLPAGYRDRIKSLCIDRSLFSGDAVTGGINLNICALIANVAAENWLASTGVLAFLMPETLLFQQSYEGFRRFKLAGGERLWFQRVDDWTRAGHPFAPVTQKFLTYFIAGSERDYSKGIEVRCISKKKGTKRLATYEHENQFAKMEDIFETTTLKAVTANPNNTIFSYSADDKESKLFSSVAGSCHYLGREGIEFYPQELFLLRVLERKAKTGLVAVENFQNQKSKHRIAKQERVLETRFLSPLIKGVQIERFKLVPSEFVVPFPYEEGARAPIPYAKLAKEAPKLEKYFADNRNVMEAQTSYNERIIGKKHASEYYALARVGGYTYGKHFVAFRDNTKWGAVVVGELPTPWGERKRPVFQNHAVSISQRADGSFITRDEAHYVCAILNAPVVGRFLLQSSDSRSFKIRPPVHVPPFDKTNIKHIRLVELSRRAHARVHDAVAMAAIDAEIDAVYTTILKAT